MSGSDDELRALITTKFRIEPCHFQVEAIDAIRRGFHLFVIASTGAGKTIPLADLHQSSGPP
jgi:Lhr-like helicase